MEVIVKWNDDTFNRVLLSDLLPSLVKNAEGLWVHEPTWSCKIINFTDFDNILVQWADGTTNVISGNDLQASENSTNVLWRYDTTWCGKLMQEGSKKSIVSTRNAQFSKNQKHVTIIPPEESDATDSEDEDDNVLEHFRRNGAMEADSSSEEDNIQDIDSIKPQRSLKNIQWCTQNEPLLLNPTWLGSRMRAEDIRSPIDCFEDYLNDEFLEYVSYQSNLYARQNNPNSTFNLTHERLQKFIGVSFWMSLFGIKSTYRFWSNRIRLSVVADVMARDDWLSIKNSLHFVDNQSQEEHNKNGKKFIWLINHFNKVASKIEMSEKLCIDEQILPTKTRKSSLKQYLPKKPKKMGFQNFRVGRNQWSTSCYRILSGKKLRR